MAKTKKAEVLTLEEKLQQALVPQEEQPYKVPDNWCWVDASMAFNIEYGKGLSSKKLVQEGYPVFGANGQIGYYTEFIYDDIKALMSCRGAYSGTMNLSLPKSFVTSNSLIIDAKLSDISAVFIFYLFMAINKNRLVSGTAQPQVTVQAFKNFPVPFPPLPEQQRIADRIESLFAKLDEAKEKAQEVVDGFEERKAAILHKAFTGELTAKWRAEHGIGMDSWEEIELGEVFALKAGKNIKANEISNIQKKDFVFPCFGGNGIRGYVNRYNKEGDIPIIGRQGALCGNINLAKGKFYATEHAVMVDYKKDCDTIFVVEYLKYLNLNKYATATAQPGLAVSNLMKIPIVYVPYNEQKILSKLLNRLLTEEQHAKEAAESVLEQIDLIKKSILAKAFRGELGTNNPGEESAVELLKACLQSK